MKKNNKKNIKSKKTSSKTKSNKTKVTKRTTSKRKNAIKYKSKAINNNKIKQLEKNNLVLEDNNLKTDNKVIIKQKKNTKINTIVEDTTIKPREDDLNTVKPKRIKNKKQKIQNIKSSSVTKIENEAIQIPPEKKKVNAIFYQILILIIFIGCFYAFYYFNSSPIPQVKSISLDKDNNVKVIYKISNVRKNKVYCYYSNEDKMPKVNDKNWFITKNNKCSFKMEDKEYYVFLKNENNIIVKVNGSENLGTILSLKLNKNKIYLPIGGTFKAIATYEKLGKIDKNITWISDDEKIAVVKDGFIKGVSKGTVNITASIMNKKTSIKVSVTDLITKRPSDGFDFKKPQLSCNKYSQVENDLIDEILKTNINEAGYKTRAGVVEAARFLTLDFPYRINYFYENGRQTTNNVDGEGRYYHVGMYLHESRFSNITGSQKGPKIWGCYMFDRPVNKQVVNGLDCSGFVSWALLNGGFDVKDVGAGWSNNLDLTDYGDVYKIDSSLINSNRIKVGDLLHSTAAGGHIGIIVGLDSSNYYVAQALWYNEIGVQITKIEKDKLYKTFPHVVLMDKYYKNDGNLTNMW